MGKKRVIQKKGEYIKQEDKAIKVAPSGKNLKEGRVYIYSSYNNTLVSLTDTQGNALYTTSAGAVGFKGTKKSTPFAASKVIDSLSLFAKNKGIEKIDVFLNGIGPGRESALRALGSKGFEISSIKDVTSIAHNGPKAPKVRRV